MTGPIQIVTRHFSDCLPAEIDDFKALVLAGGEVEPEGLEDRIRRAASLVFLYIGCCLCGVGALKLPNSAYRQGVSSKSKVPLPEHQFPYELGWVFVMPSARGRRFSNDLTRAALSKAGAGGVFATSWTNNEPMHAALRKCGFESAGEAWESERLDRSLQLFLRRGQKRATEVSSHQ
jgi:hypothetical protein